MTGAIVQPCLQAGQLLVTSSGRFAPSCQTGSSDGGPSLSPFLQRCHENRRGVCSECLSGTQGSKNVKTTSNARDIVVVAASLGGLQALRKILSSLPPDLPASVFIVMHIGAWPSRFPRFFRLTVRCRSRMHATASPSRRATVYVAPPDRHMLTRNGVIVLSTGPKENFTRPAADPLFRSAAVEYGPRAIGVILTGKVDDGAAGLKAVDACGGFTIVQDPSSCVAPDMPKAALQAVSPDRVVPLEDIAAAIVSALTDDSRKGVSMNERERIALETKIAMTGKSSPADLERLGHRSGLTCPDCGGVVWRIGDDLPLRYRCHTGHAFSALSLECEQRSGAKTRSGQRYDAWRRACC